MTVALLSALVAVMPARVAVAPEPRVLWQWTASDGSADWQPNDQIRDLAVGDGAMSFRTTGTDPILEYKPRLDVPTSLWQAFEVRLKADRDDRIELFWTETAEGPYGGFSQSKVSHVAVRGDGQWRTYRVYPFWQKAGRIIKLRFDPYEGATFAIALMRIVEVSAPTPTGTSVRLPRDHALWQTMQGLTVARVANGLKLSPTESGGFGLVPIRPLDAETNPSVSVRMSATQARRSALVFACDGEFGLHETQFAVIADGRPHTYNLDMLSHPSWKGRVLAVGLRPGVPCTLHGLSVAARPQGPADLRIESFDAEEALPRAGRPMTLVARVTNLGGVPARKVTARLMLPSGLRFATGSSGMGAPIGNLHFGQDHSWSWKAIAARPGKYPVRLRVSSASGGSVEVSTTVAVTQRPQVARTGYPPEPKAVRGKLDVGVYYFPGWRTSGQWAPITRFPERRPVLGWFREGDPSVADWHIKWAVEHGITFFAYDWYWSAGARHLEHALHEGYFNSRYRDRIKFCLLWANHNPDGTSSHEDFMNVVRYWIEHYFRRPEHYTIGGKPVMIIFSPYRFRADMGSDAVRRSFDAMRQECMKAGLPGLYILGCVGGDVSEARLLEREGYDAVTAYNWPHLGVRGSERWAPYADLLKPHRELWERYAAESPLPIMTPVNGGWDSRPWHGDTALVRSNRTPALFKKHLQDARNFIEANPTKALPVALIEAWNEFGEGSYIEPHRQYGFGYLDAVRDVFADTRTPHTDLTPDDVGHQVPQVNVAAALNGSWDLGKDPAGWESGMNLGDFRPHEGALRCITTGNDAAFFGPPMQVSAAERGTLRVRMRLTPPGGAALEDTAQVFWTKRSAGTSEAASVRFPVHLDGKWHAYSVPLSGNPRWRGVITGLRLDPCNQSGVVVDLARVELVK